MSAMMSHLNRDLTSFSYYESPQQSEPALIAAEETTVMNVKEYSFVPVTDMLDCLDYRTRCKLLVEAAAAHPPDGIHHPPPPPPQSAETTARPAKRARTDGGESAPPPTAYSPDQLTEMLTSLTPAARAKLLIEAAASSPTTAGKIAFAHNAKVKRDAAKPARDAAKPQDFWPLYLKAMDQMLVRHEHLSQPRQRTKGFDLAFAIDKMLATIVSKTRPESSWETKFSAVFTVREIFSMMDENGMIPRVVRQNCLDWGPKLVAVVKTCDEEELGRLRAASVKPAEGKTDLFINHFEQMVRMTEAYCIEDYLCTKEAWGLLIAGRRNGGEGEAGGAGIVPGAGTCTADSGEAAGDAAGGTAVGITCTGRISTGGGRGPDCLTSYQTFMGPCKRVRGNKCE
ncbi:hypothetical protein GE09DRAFT_1154675 [Coniochaeta sp. 2T2.1]|nr:hypothetical protein GE09DRAFT_1154675 [Coniochaeta sp. 2T2.1]